MMIALFPPLLPFDLLLLDWLGKKTAVISHTERPPFDPNFIIKRGVCVACIHVEHELCSMCVCVCVKPTRFFCWERVMRWVIAVTGAQQMQIHLPPLSQPTHLTLLFFTLQFSSHTTGNKRFKSFTYAVCEQIYLRILCELGLRINAETGAGVTQGKLYVFRSLAFILEIWSGGPGPGTTLS